MELRLPRDKLNRLKDLLAEWQFKKVCSREMLENLLGHLNHAYSVGSQTWQVIDRQAHLITDVK